MGRPPIQLTVYDNGRVEMRFTGRDNFTRGGSPPPHPYREYAAAIEAPRDAQADADVEAATVKAAARLLRCAWATMRVLETDDYREDKDLAVICHPGATIVRLWEEP